VAKLQRKDSVLTEKEGQPSGEFEHVLGKEVFSEWWEEGVCLGENHLVWPKNLKKRELVVFLKKGLYGNEAGVPQRGRS